MNYYPIHQSSFITSLSVRYHLVYQPVFFCLLRAHDPVALNVALNHFNGLSAMFGQYLAGQLAHSHNLFGVNSDVCRLAGNPAN
jgi:hypothetical protein